MKDTLNAPEYNGVDVLTELDMIADKVEMSDISKKILIQELQALICKLEGVEVKKPRPHRKPKSGVLIHKLK